MLRITDNEQIIKCVTVSETECYYAIDIIIDSYAEISVGKEVRDNKVFSCIYLMDCDDLIGEIHLDIEFWDYAINDDIYNPTIYFFKKTESNEIYRYERERE